MRKFQRDIATGVIAAVVGGIILDLITQHGGWSWHAFLAQGVASGTAAGAWKIIGIAKIMMILAIVAVIAAIFGSLMLVLLM
jgi:hypothetical protein